MSNTGNEPSLYAGADGRGHEVERCLPDIVEGVDVCAAVQEGLDSLDVLPPGGDVESTAPGLHVLVLKVPPAEERAMTLR